METAAALLALGIVILIVRAQKRKNRRKRRATVAEARAAVMASPLKKGAFTEERFGEVLYRSQSWFNDRITITHSWPVEMKEFEFLEFKIGKKITLRLENGRITHQEWGGWPIKQPPDSRDPIHRDASQMLDRIHQAEHQAGLDRYAKK